jgi:hypothetical protein
MTTETDNDFINRRVDHTLHSMKLDDEVAAHNRAINHQDDIAEDKARAEKRRSAGKSATIVSLAALVAGVTIAGINHMTPVERGGSDNTPADIQPGSVAGNGHIIIEGTPVQGGHETVSPQGDPRAAALVDFEKTGKLAGSP